MQNESTEHLLSIHQAAADIQRFVAHQLASGKVTISRDRRGDISRHAERITELTAKLA